MQVARANGWEALSMNVTQSGSPGAGCRPAGISGQARDAV